MPASAACPLPAEKGVACQVASRNFSQAGAFWLQLAGPSPSVPSWDPGDILPLLHRCARAMWC